MKLNQTTMYKEITLTVRGYDYCFSYPDKQGHQTLDDLYHWESNDRANRELFICENLKKAQSDFYQFQKLFR